MTRFALITACLLIMMGCKVGPKYRPPVTQAPPVYKEPPPQFKEEEFKEGKTDIWKVAEPSDAMLRGNWWEIFNDPELNALEEQLNIDNQNIKQSFENFMAARAIVREARAQLFPTVATSPAYSRTKSSGNLGGSFSPQTGVIPGLLSKLYSFPVDVSWTADLFGKIRKTVQEQQYTAQLSAADLENERLTEQASLATFFFEIRGQDALQKVLNDTVEADKKSLELTKAQYDTGLTDFIAVVQAQVTLETVKATAINLGIARAQFEHAIAVLIGKPASEFSIPVRPMTTAPPPIPIGVPSQLLERRPDIAAAERNMAIANAEIGIAKAAYFPTLTLASSGGFQSTLLSKLFEWPSRFWAIGGTLTQTIFEGGLRGATVDQFVATYNSALAAYRQTVLTAFQQVEDNLASVGILSEQIAQLQKAVASAQTNLELELARYETGLDPYIDVVIAQTVLLNNQQLLVGAQISQMTSAVQLITALGGGWDRSELPTPSEVTKRPPKAERTIQH